MGSQMSAIQKGSSLGCILQNWKLLGITPWLRNVSVGKKPVHWKKMREINQESTENLWHSFRCFRQCLQIYTTIYPEPWEGNAKQKKNDGDRTLLSWHSSWPQEPQWTIDRGRKSVKFLDDTGTTYSVLNIKSGTLNHKTCRIMGLSRKAHEWVFIGPSECKVGKHRLIHSFLYVPTHPILLPGRDMLINWGWLYT